MSETHQEFEFQRRELLQASQWADQAQRDRIDLRGEFGAKETDFIMKVKSKQTRRSKNYEEFIEKKNLKFEDHNLTNCLYKKKEIRIL